MPEARTSDLHPILQALARAQPRRAGAQGAGRTTERFCAEGRLALDAVAVQGCEKLD